MTKNLHETPSVSVNPVSLSVSDISDSMPMCHEDVPMLSIDDLTLPFCDTAKSDNPIPQYCISSKHSGDCLSCNLSSGCKDCQGHEIYLSWDEPQAEPVMMLEPVDDDEDILEPMDDDEEPDRPSYCSQNGGDCSTCSLVNYGIDCMNNPVSDREVING